MTPAFSPSCRRVAFGICMGLAVLVFIVFGQTARFGFVNLDDANYVYQNPIVKNGLSPGGIQWAFTHVLVGHWHPLTTIAFMVDCQLFGVWAGGHHMVNVLLHATAVALLFLALQELTGAIWRCAFVAAVFAIHPLRAESVAWVSELKDVLSGVFFMLTLLAYVRYVRRPGKGGYALVLLCFILGLLSKPMLVTIPCVLLIIDYWPLGRIRAISDFAWLLWEKVPLFLLSALSSVAAILALKSGDAPTSTYPANIPIAYAVYLEKLFVPTGLAVLYPMPREGWPAWDVFNALLLLITLSAAAWLLRRRQPWLLSGWLWYLCMLIPVAGIMQTGEQAYADRYTYLPQIGLCIAVTWMAADWLERLRHGRSLATVFAMAVLCALTIAGRRQTAYWRDGVTLWTHALDCTPDNFIARNSLGEALAQEGKLEAAMDQFNAAMEFDSGSPEIHVNIGTTLFQQGHTKDAIAQFRQALAINPTYPEAHYNLGSALDRDGEIAEAIDEYREAVRLRPGYAEAHYNLGTSLYRLRRGKEAAAEFSEALKIAPRDAKTHYNLALALFEQGEFDQGIAECRAALQIDPDYAEAHNNLANALLQEGHLEEAITECREALQIRPDYAAAHANIGVALLQQGNVAEAIEHFRAALKIDPGLEPARAGLARALANSSRPAASPRPTPGQ
jgi:tetratricopeptide (TPR) repeat protein